MRLDAARQAMQMTELPDRPKILIVKMWAIGDVLMATPLLRALHGRYPGCRITWFVDRRYASILDGNPMIDEVIAFDARLWQKRFRYGQVGPYLSMTLAMRRDLLRRGFDAVINLTAEKWWAAWFGVAPVRIGLFPRAKPGWMGRLYSTAIPRGYDPYLHNTDHYLLPAAALGIDGPYDRRMSVPLRPEDDNAVQAFLDEQPSYRKDRPLVVLHPGTSQASKCWPTDYFSQLIDRIGDRCNVVITGSPDEAALARSIVEGVSSRMADVSARPMIAAGTLPDLRQTVALVRQAAAVVTGDTSVLHIASAVETPLIGIYGSTRPGDNAPYYGEHVYVYNDSVECSPCGQAQCPLTGVDHMKCMRTLTPERVHNELVQYLETDFSAKASR